MTLVMKVDLETSVLDPIETRQPLDQVGIS
jgi:hypothetical protein